MIQPRARAAGGVFDVGGVNLAVGTAEPRSRCPCHSKQCADVMKRIAILVFYGVGALAILYLALFAYAAFTGRDLQPGDPIRIFRRPDAPAYSAASGVDFA